MFCPQEIVSSSLQKQLTTIGFDSVKCDFFQHIDSSVHKEKLAHVRMRRAVFEDISEDSTIPPFEDIVVCLFS
ncbi:unnamed protein product [Toxocara canis]|uniref:RNA_pol_Rpb5_N domain-containing protein n=1 Tax=Toxocara canis TaxID=6265 RepID=A0A183UH27_TOXCA|nr:unnamed protein product [Toxocara canis]